MLEQFVFRAVDEVGATLNAALVVMGDRLGLYRAMAGAGPLTAAEIAERTGTIERYVREWLNAQAAGGYVAYHPEDDGGRYSLPPEQAVALTDAGFAHFRIAAQIPFNNVVRGPGLRPLKGPASAGPFPRCG
jgi:winged helix-turn-helix protein